MGIALVLLTVAVSGLCFLGFSNMKSRGLKPSLSNFMLATNGNGIILFCLIPFALPFVLVQLIRETNRKDEPQQ